MFDLLIVNTTNSTLINNDFQDKSLLTSLIFNGVLGLLIIILFLFFKKRVKHVYEPTITFDSPRGGLIGWISSAYNLTEESINQERGLDALMYLKVTKYLFVASIIYCFYGCILIPVHITGGNDLDGIGMLGISNVKNSSLRLIADVIGILFNSVVGSTVLYLLYKEYSRLRCVYKSDESKIENYSVIIREIPQWMTKYEVQSAMSRIFPEKVWSILECYDTRELDKLIQKREKFGNKLEHAEAYYYKKGKFRKRCCIKVNEMDYYQNLFNDYNSKVNNLLENFNGKPGTTMFAVFRDRSVPMILSQTSFNNDIYKQPLNRTLIIENAPSPDSIIWKNLNNSHTNSLVRSLVVNVFTTLLVVFWMVPIGIASSISNLSTLTKIFPFLIPFLNEFPQIKNGIQGFLPGLALIIFINILARFIVVPMSKLEGHYSYSTVETGIFTKYYLFLLVNVFLGSIFAQGVFYLLPQIIENPMNIIYILSDSLPSQTEYFIEYVMILSLTKSFLELLRPHHLLMHFLKHNKCSLRTKRETRPSVYYFDMSIQYAFHCLVFIIITSFSTLNPLVLPFGVMYYGCSYIISKYNLCYVYTPQFESNGNIFPIIFNRLCFSLIVYQLLLIGVLTTVGFTYAPFILILVIFQILFWKLTREQLEKVCEFGSLNNGLGHHSNEAMAVLDVSQYKSPSLKPPSFQLENQSNNNYFLINNAN